MSKLFLASSFADVANILGQFEENISGKRVTFNPTASKVEKVIFYVNSGKKALEKLGLIIDKLDVSMADQEVVIRAVRWYINETDDADIHLASAVKNMLDISEKETKTNP